MQWEGYGVYLYHYPPESKLRVSQQSALCHGLCELEEGVRMLTNIVDCDPETVAIGMPVEVTFEDVTSEISVPLFKPAS